MSMRSICARLNIDRQGGWPMTVFLDADGRPFHAGTYFPPTDRHGMPSFLRVLHTISGIWESDRSRVDHIAGQLTAAVAGHRRASAPAVDVGNASAWNTVAESAVGGLAATYDSRAGGFGRAPKFPQGMVLDFLLRHHARTASPQALQMAEGTLESMARGGMYDQLGGGFARYSTDSTWTVPHFEKMLYDNAILARTYLHWWTATQAPLAEQVATQTLDFLLAELQVPSGGFASALDADSDPVLPGQAREGAYYAWSPDQLGEALAAGGLTAEQAAATQSMLGVTPIGSFENGTSVLQLRSDPADPELWAAARGLLLAARHQRPRPARDDKVVAGWNGLAIAALAEAGVVLERPDYLSAARRAAGVLLRVHRQADGSWVRVSRGHMTSPAPAMLEDLAGVAEGFLALYQATGAPHWFRCARSLAHQMVAQFSGPDGTFYETPSESAGLPTRPQDPADNATPSGWSLATGVLLAVGQLDGSSALLDRADASLRALLHAGAFSQPQFAGWSLGVVEAVLSGPVEIAVIGDTAGAQDLHRAALAHPLRPVVAYSRQSSDEPALLADRSPMASGAAAYVCRNMSCRMPTDDPATMRRLLEHTDR